MKLDTVLEEQIDEYGLVAVLECISSICAEKASHIRTSYGDNLLANAWDTTGEAIQSFTYTLPEEFEK